MFSRNSLRSHNHNEQSHAKETPLGNQSTQRDVFLKPYRAKVTFARFTR